MSKAHSLAAILVAFATQQAQAQKRFHDGLERSKPELSATARDMNSLSRTPTLDLTGGSKTADSRTWSQLGSLSFENPDTGRPATIRELCATPLPGEQTQACRIEFQGVGVSAGLQTLFGHRTGERVNMGLLRLSTGIRFGLDPEGDKDQFVRLDGELAGSRDADAIVPGQQDLEYYQGRLVAGSDVLGRRGSDNLAGNSGLLNWQIEYERIGNSPTGLEKLDAVTITPVRVSSDNVTINGWAPARGYIGLAASVGMRFEDSYFDPNFMANTAPNEDASLHNVGLVCDLSGYWESERGGFQILGKSKVFISDLEQVRRWDAGLEMTAPLLRNAQDCRIGLEIDYQDNNDPTGNVTWYRVMGKIKF